MTKGDKMLEFIMGSFIIMSIVIMYVYSKEKYQEIGKMPFDKHLKV